MELYIHKVLLLIYFYNVLYIACNTISVHRHKTGDVFVTSHGNCSTNYANETRDGKCLCPNGESLIYEFDTFYCDDNPSDATVTIQEYPYNMYFIERTNMEINGTLLNLSDYSVIPFTNTCTPFVYSADVLQKNLQWKPIDGNLFLFSFSPLHIKVNASFNTVKGRQMLVTITCDYITFYAFMVKFQGNATYNMPNTTIPTIPPTISTVSPTISTIAGTATPLITADTTAPITSVTPSYPWVSTDFTTTTNTTQRPIVIVTAPPSSSDSKYIIVIGVCVGIVGILIGVICTLIYRKRKKHENHLSMSYKKDISEDRYPGYVTSPTKLPSDPANGFYSAYLSTEDLQPRNDIPRTLSMDRPVTPRPSDGPRPVTPRPTDGPRPIAPIPSYEANYNSLYPNYSYPDSFTPSSGGTLPPRPRSPRPLVGPLSFKGEKDTKDEVGESYVDMKSDTKENEYGENYMSFTDSSEGNYAELSVPSESVYEVSAETGKDSKDDTYQPIPAIEPDLYE